ncbi:MAG: OadG-related small transporter subunit [Eubacteriales bacterium]|jgi:Na+-transporting methylmalonyl-CoA/oxaloacetate decarboxylase gamma subunit
MTQIGAAFTLMGYGLMGVFSVLIVFYLVIKLLGRIFPEEER